MLHITELKCMGMKNPLGISTGCLEFSWKVESDRYNTRQVSYRIVVKNEGGEIFWDSMEQKGDACSAIFYEGLALKPRTRYEWAVTIRDNYGDFATANDEWFETGFGEAEKWGAKWISPRQSVSKDAFCDWPAEKLAEHFGPVNFVGLDKGNTEGTAPARYLRREFTLDSGQVQRARLYITAGGIYEAFLNGNAVTDTLLNPGFTPYDKYFEYQSFDVTKLLEKENALGVILADGWYKGRNGIGGLRELYGKQTRLLAELFVTYIDGRTEIIPTDGFWKSAESPYEYADLFVGEYYDARKELDGWDFVGYDDRNWTAVEELPDESVSLKGCFIPPVRIVKRLKPKALFQNDIGETILDMGQNMAGVVKADFYNMCPGTEVIFEHTEMLDADGHYMNSINPECRELIDHYICKGGVRETYCPRFTFHGFRYVRITGLSGCARAEDFEGLVFATDLEKTMEFSCDNSDINQLQYNIYWSQLGNFLGIPTDCPQREKAGWTGDVFVYAGTAAYVQDVRMFLKRWLSMARLEQFENGIIPVTVPYTKNYYYIQDFVFKAHTSCGWGDAIVEVPWALYRQYGDITFLRDNYEAMKKWMHYVENDAATGRKEGFDKMPPRQQARQKYLWNTGFHYGDWSYPSCRNARGETDNLQSSLNTREYVATAIYANSCQVMAWTAETLGDEETAAHYRELNEKIRQAYQEEYIDEDGRFPLPIQGLYVLSLAMDLVSGERARRMAAHLNNLIIRNGYCLDTGFMSIKYLLDSLCRYGYQKTAEKLLLQEKCPSWLYEVKHGATTIWSKWNAVQPETGKVTCASYNHYSFGSVGKWIYNRILGIDLLEGGFRRFQVEPGFSYPFQWAKGTYRSIYGDIYVHWRKEDGKRILDLRIPVSTEAVVRLSDCNVQSLDSYFAGRLQEGSIVLGSGAYRICYEVN